MKKRSYQLPEKEFALGSGKLPLGGLPRQSVRSKSMDFSHISSVCGISFSPGKQPPNIDIDLKDEHGIVSPMPLLNKIIPPDDGSLPPVTDVSHLQYLQVSRK